MRKLTAKETLFVGHYLERLNGADAARKAGYKTKRPDALAYELLRKPEIQAAIQAAMDARADRVQITADQVLQNIIDIGQRCMQRWPKMVGHGKDREQAKEWVTTEDGEEVLAHVFEFDAQGALRAQELLGKHLKLFTDKQEVEVKGGVTLHLPDQFETAEEWEAGNKD